MLKVFLENGTVKSVENENAEPQEFEVVTLDAQAAEPANPSEPATPAEGQEAAGEGSEAQPAEGSQPQE